MTASQPPQDSVSPAILLPLDPLDPPKIGDFWLDARAAVSPAGIVFTGHNQHTPALIVMLSASAADDLAARDRFAGAINELHIDTVLARGGHGQDEGRLAVKYRAEDDDPIGPDDLPLAPWAALRFDGSPQAVVEGRRILNRVDLSRLPPKGTPKGPDYALPWTNSDKPGRWRLWPLPWPGRTDRAGWVTILVSWLLMMLIAAVAIVVAIVLFRNAPKDPPPPPVPTTMTSPPPSSSSPSSASPSSASPSSASPSSASPSSASPSPSSASPTPSDSGSASPTPSDSGSPSPSPTPSDSAGTPTPNSKL